MSVFDCVCLCLFDLVCACVCVCFRVYACVYVCVWGGNNVIFFHKFHGHRNVFDILIVIGNVNSESERRCLGFLSLESFHIYFFILSVLLTDFLDLYFLLFILSSVASLIVIAHFTISHSISPHHLNLLMRDFYSCRYS